MDRRSFLKTGAAATVAAATAGSILSSCNGTGNSPKALGPMKQNFEGIGLLGYGAMRWPVIKDEEGKKTIDQARVDEMIDLAMASGINYYDSAPVYLGGQSEEATGLSLSRYSRDSYKVATKLSNFRKPWTFEGGVEMYRKSLEYFRTDYIDYYLLHSIWGYQALKDRFIDNGLLDFCLKEREAGHIRNLGFSFHGAREGFDELIALHPKYHWDFVQIQMNYLDWNHAGGDAEASYMYEKLTELGIPVVIMEPLRGGDLAELPAPLADKLKAQAPDRSVASWAFRFCGSHPNVLTVLSGMNCLEHLQDNLDTFCDFEPLSDSDEVMLEDIAAKISEYSLVPCTGCRYCMPCPYGIDIPGIFKFYNRNIKDNTYVISAEQQGFAKARRKYLLDYDASVATVSQADRCIKCGRCIEKCPQHIQIPEELLNIYEYVEELRKGTL